MRFFWEWMFAMTEKDRGLGAAASAYYSAPRARRTRSAGALRRGGRRAQPPPIGGPPQHRDLLDRDRAEPRGGPRAGDRGRRLLRHDGGRLGLHDRLPG